MLSAISFGVFCPLGALDQLDHAVDEGRALRCRNPHADPVGQHLGAAGHRRTVAAGFADHGRGLAGDGGLVDGRDALDHLAIGGNGIAGLDQNEVPHLEAGARHQLEGAVRAGQQLGLALGAGLAQRFGLRLAAAFGHGFGKIGKQHREPEPDDDLEGKAEIPAARNEVAQEDHSGERGHDLDHEHHRILDHQARIELGEGRADRGHDDLGIEHRRDGRAFLQFHGIHGGHSKQSEGCRSEHLLFRTLLFKTLGRRSSRDARRWGRGRGPGRRSGRR